MGFLCRPASGEDFEADAVLGLDPFGALFGEDGADGADDGVAVDSTWPERRVRPRTHSGHGDLRGLCGLSRISR